MLNGHHAALLVFLVGVTLSASAEPMRLVSALDGSQSAAAGGGGDSGSPILSAHGRYVLFASSAANLLVTSNNTAMSTPGLPTLNVFLRDRTNGTTSLVSVNLAGTGGGNDNSLPVDLSTNGRYAAFESSASDLVAGDTNGASDVFVRDLVTGTTILVSVSTNGGGGNGASRSAAMTPDGRYVAFVSAASNLVPGDTNGIGDVFVRDLQTQVTTLASVGARPLSAGSSSETPVLTPDGRYVAFCSTASNLVSGVLNAEDIYVRDLVGGITVWASTGAWALGQSVLNASKVACYNHAISADGKFVAYEASATSSGSLYQGLILRYSLDTGATDLVNANATVQSWVWPGVRDLDMTPDGQRIVFVASTNGTSGTTTCILLWDAATGATTLVSGDLSNSVVTNSTCDWPTIDPTGQFVDFVSSATNLTTNTLLGDWHFYSRDLQAGATTLLNADANGIGTSICALSQPCLSADRRFAAFECDDGNLAPDDRNHDSDLFVRDLVTGAVELISARHPALASLSPNGPTRLSAYGVSADGRFVVFASDADNLIPNDTNNCRDVFARDQVAGTNILVSAATNGLTGDGFSFEPAISADGRYIAFTSVADNLVEGDTNQRQDVFVRDVQTGITALVSVNSSGVSPGNNDSYSPVISSGGRYVMFRSKATNLAAGSFTGTENLFLRDLPAGATWALTTGGLSNAVMTPDGRFVAFVNSRVGSSGGNLYVWDSATATRVYTNSTSAITTIAISPDGNRLAYWAGTTTPQLFAADFAAHTNWMIGSGTPASRPGLHFSADHRFLAHAVILNKTNQVYLYDFQTGTNLLVSRSFNSAAPGDGSSDTPDISADGRFVAYRSAATDIVPGDTNGVPNIFLFDQQTGATMLLSISRFGNFAANNHSHRPVFSADGQTLVFQTWATDLVDADFNQGSDLVAYSLSSSGSIPLFYATIHPGGASSPGPWITWPVIPGKSYRVQFKSSPGDSSWQDFSGSVTILGSQGCCQDLLPATTQRFYRIVGF